ncbi:MAG: hypothetical protein JOZ41_22205 [Chloroflexi bacterium]|nr:hypothetical protein [Chloroflexota bacterium]
MAGTLPAMPNRVDCMGKMAPDEQTAAEIDGPPPERTRIAPHAMRDHRERIGLAFFWLIVLAYGFFVPDIPNWNTESHLYAAFSIVDRNTLNIDAYRSGLGDRSYWKGHYYSDKAPGLALLAVPIYAGLRTFLGVRGQGFLHFKQLGGQYYYARSMAFLRFGITYLVVSLPSAALAVLLWLFLLRLGAGTGWALLLAGVYALGTTAYVYSIWYYSHQACAVFLFAAFLLLFDRVRHKPSGRRPLLAAAAAGLLAGYSVICEYPTAAIVAFLAVYLLAVARDRKLTLTAFLAAMIPAASLNLAYNLIAFGQPFATGYMHLHSSAYHSDVHGGPLGLAGPAAYGIQAPTPTSFWQITFGLYRGIFPLCPVLLLFFAGAVFMWRRRDVRPEWWLCVGIVLVYFVIDASRGQDMNGWSGGASVASRHLVPMLPFMIVPIVFGLRDRLFRTCFLMLGAVSVALMFMVVSATYPFSYQDANPLGNEVFPNFFHGRIVLNWILVGNDTFGLAGVESLLPFVGLALCLVARIVWLLRIEPRAAAVSQTAKVEAG